MDFLNFSAPAIPSEGKGLWTPNYNHKQQQQCMF